MQERPAHTSTISLNHLLAQLLELVCLKFYTLPLDLTSCCFFIIVKTPELKSLFETRHISNLKEIQMQVKLITSAAAAFLQQHTQPTSPVLSPSTSSNCLYSQTITNVTPLTVLTNIYRYGLLSVEKLRQVFSSIATRAVLYLNVISATQLIRGQSRYCLLLML